MNKLVQSGVAVVSELGSLLYGERCQALVFRDAGVVPEKLRALANVPVVVVDEATYIDLERKSEEQLTDEARAKLEDKAQRGQPPNQDAAYIVESLTNLGYSREQVVELTSRYASHLNPRLKPDTRPARFDADREAAVARLTTDIAEIRKNDPQHCVIIEYETLLARYIA